MCGLWNPISNRLLQNRGCRYVEQLIDLIGVRYGHRPATLRRLGNHEKELGSRRHSEGVGQVIGDTNPLNLAFDFDSRPGFIAERCFGGLHLSLRRHSNEGWAVGDENSPTANRPDEPLALKQFKSFAYDDV